LFVANNGPDDYINQMNSFKAVTISIFLLTFANLASASTILSCDDAQAKGAQDYGDAPSSYGSACNKTPRWQRLGTEWNNDNINQAEGADDGTDDGVSWRTSSDGGSTWTDYSTTGTLTQGDEVQFKFEMNRSTDGNHKYDQLKAWVDWNGNGTWENDRSEKIIKRNWWKNEDSDGISDDGGTKNNDLSNWAENNWNLPNRELRNWDIDSYRGQEIFNSNDTQRFFYKKMTIPLDAAIGDTWMRARVVCENSLSNTNYNANYNMHPTGYQDQGETEDYKLTIVARTVEVPEPSTFLILVTGLIALFSRRKRFSR